MAFPSPVIKRRWWPVPLVWAIPILALVVAGYYVHVRQRDRGPEIVISFRNATGVKAGETTVNYRGADVGQVSGVELSGDLRSVRVSVRLKKSAGAFAKDGAEFWIVRPEISAESVSGLGTIVSGPYIEARPGAGKGVTEFDGLQRAPIVTEDGLAVVLHAAQADRVQAEEPVYYRGVQVGVVRAARLAADATTVDIDLSIWRPYRRLVRSNSVFWTVKPADIQGGVFSGLRVSVGTLRSFIQGGIAFASPDDPVGKEIEDGKEFTLHDEVKREWTEWAPRLPVEREEEGNVGQGAGGAGAGN